MMAPTPLTVAESRAILVADRALDATYETRLASGDILGAAESEAWIKLVESANSRIALYEGRREDS